MQNNQYEKSAGTISPAYQGYTNLDQTYGGKQASGRIPSMATQVIPVYKSLGYNALTHNVPTSGNNHFSVSNAYPGYPGNCTENLFYAQRKCDGFVQPSQMPSTKVVEGFAYFM
jgi:hypothetical protein